MRVKLKEFRSKFPSYLERVGKKGVLCSSINAGSIIFENISKGAPRDTGRLQNSPLPTINRGEVRELEDGEYPGSLPAQQANAAWSSARAGQTLFINVNARSDRQRKKNKEGYASVQENRTGYTEKAVNGVGVSSVDSVTVKQMENVKF